MTGIDPHHGPTLDETQARWADIERGSLLERAAYRLGPIVAAAVVIGALVGAALIVASVA